MGGGRRKPGRSSKGSSGRQKRKPDFFVPNAGMGDISRACFKKIGGLAASDKILLVGEGDFSFALALAASIGAQNVVATCYDTASDLKAKYDKAIGNAKVLQSFGASVHLRVDCRQLHDNAKLGSARWDRIVFCFPHVGGSDKGPNVELLDAFFRSAKRVLSPRGEVHLALRQTPFYDSWDVDGLAKKNGMTKKRTEPFDVSLFPNYTPQRTDPHVRAAPETDNSFWHVFGAGAAVEPTVAPAMMSDLMPLRVARKPEPATVVSAVAEEEEVVVPMRKKRRKRCSGHCTCSHC